MEQQKTIQQQDEVEEMQHGPVPVDQLQASGIASIDAKAPLWKFVKKIKKYGGGGSWEWQCSFCKSTYRGSHTRVNTHLLHKGRGIANCTEISTEAQAEIAELVHTCKEKTLRTGDEGQAQVASLSTRSSHKENKLLKEKIKQLEDEIDQLREKLQNKGGEKGAREDSGNVEGKDGETFRL